VYSNEDFRLIREEGFDHVRIPVAWHLYAGPAPGYSLYSTIFSLADALVNGALDHGLAVIVDLHHFDEFTSTPLAFKAKFISIWRQVAKHYASFPSAVAFELLNEPKDNATTDAMNPIYADVIREIRVSNPDRTIFVGPINYNSIDELKTQSGQGLQLPNDDLNLIATVHMYDPYYFTHQGAEWALPDTATTGVLFPGPPSVPIKPDSRITHTWVLDWFGNYNRLSEGSNPSSAKAFTSRLNRAKAWSDVYGRPVHVGEYGCYEKADDRSRVNFYSTIRTEMGRRGLGWAMWDWKAGFHYAKNGRPHPTGMREAIFPAVQLATSGAGRLLFDGAIGKTYVVEKAESLLAPITWVPIHTETLKSPRFDFSDPGAEAGPGGYYRVQWVK